METRPAKKLKESAESENKSITAPLTTESTDSIKKENQGNHQKPEEEKPLGDNNNNSTNSSKVEKQMSSMLKSEKPNPIVLMSPQIFKTHLEDTVVLDESRIEEISGGDISFVDETFQMLKECFDEKIPMLQENLNRKDQKGCVDVAHELKGACLAIFGSCRLSKVFERIELISRVPEFDRAKQTFEEHFETKKLEASEALEKYIKARKTPETDKNE